MEDTAAPPQDCGSLITEAKARSAETIEDCREIGLQVLSIRQSCDPEGGADASVWALLDSADCMEDVGLHHLTLLTKPLPAATAKKLTDAEGALKGEIGQICTKDCGMSYGARCTVGLLACMDSAFRLATSGALEFGAASKIGKDTRVLSDQANALCALPATAWKGGKVPANCVNSVLSWLQTCADPAGTCPNP